MKFSTRQLVVTRGIHDMIAIKEVFAKHVFFHLVDIWLAIGETPAIMTGLPMNMPSAVFGLQKGRGTHDMDNDLAGPVSDDGTISGGVLASLSGRSPKKVLKYGAKSFPSPTS